jgi:hypothetical protein
MRGVGSKQVSWICDLTSVAIRGKRRESTQKWAPARVDGGAPEDARMLVGSGQRLLHVEIDHETIDGRNK